MILQTRDLGHQLFGRQLIDVRHAKQSRLAEQPRQEALAELVLDTIGVAHHPARGQRADGERPRFLLALVDVEPPEHRHQIGRVVLDAIGEAKPSCGPVDAAATRP